MGVALLPPAEMKKSNPGAAESFWLSGVKNGDSLIFSDGGRHLQKPERSTMPENVEVAPAPTAEAQQDVAQANDAKAEANSTAKASDELSEDDLEVVAGGVKAITNYALKQVTVAART